MTRPAPSKHPLPLLLLPLLLLSGCRGSSVVRRDDVVPPFVFRSLDLRQQSPLGQPTWELTSPEARYDLRRRIAQASTPKGVIYRDGRPLYRLQADNGTVVGDGDAILLEGNLRVERLGPQPVMIRASRARWLPRRQLLLIDRQPEAFDGHGRLRAAQARFRLDEDRLELSGDPRLERWEQRFDPLANTPRPRASIEVRAENVSWKPGSGEIRASGPLRALRLPPGAPPGRRLQELAAESLVGNTQAQSYTLAGSVHFNDSAEGDSFSGRDVSLQLGKGEASTAVAFEATHGTLRIQGTGLRVNSQERQVRIAGSCRLQRPGEQLEAQSCGWNWGSGDVEAAGGVLLKRSANAQTTRGEALSGRLGEAGELRISAPGSRVVSEFLMPRRQAQPPVPARPAPPPIVP